MTRVEASDVQGDVLRPFGTVRESFVLVDLGSVAAADRAGVLAALRPHLTPASEVDRPMDHTVTAWFTALGLEQLLGPTHPLVVDLPAAFRMGARARCDLLGDGDPAAWDGRWSLPTWLVVRVTGADDTALAEMRTVVRLAFGPAARREFDGIAIDRDRRPARVGDERYEWFGFRDGISDPVLTGSGVPFRPGDGALVFPHGRLGPIGSVLRQGLQAAGVPIAAPPARWRPVRAGEFLLGYEDESGVSTLRSGSRPYLRNGTFVVFRQLCQDVARFRQTYPTAELRERAVGRKADGTLLSGRPGNAASFRDDPDGIVTPLVSHIRRANPRAGIDLSQEVTNRHRLIRRSVPYRHGPERGMLFVCYQADIERQFEFVQRRWLRQSTPLRIAPTTEPDPPDPVIEHVTTRGGVYAFQPGLAAFDRIVRDAEQAR